MSNYATSALKLSDTYVNTLPYNVCSTAAGTSPKLVDAGSFALDKGAMVVVRFNYTNSKASPELNVSSTGAKPIYYKGSAITASYLKANYVYTFVYNGSQWDLVGEINTTNTDEKVAVDVDESSTDDKQILFGTVGSAARASGSGYLTYCPSSGGLVIGEPGNSYRGYLDVNGDVTVGGGDDDCGIFPYDADVSTIGNYWKYWNRSYIKHGVFESVHVGATEDFENMGEDLAWGIHLDGESGSINASLVTATRGFKGGYIRTGQKSGSTLGSYVTIEGSNNTGSGNYSHSEGYNNTASGLYSHVGGYTSNATNNCSFAHGERCAATGRYSIAVGLRTTAAGEGSFAEGCGDNPVPTLSAYTIEAVEGARRGAFGDCPVCSYNSYWDYGMIEDDGDGDISCFCTYCDDYRSVEYIENPTPFSCAYGLGSHVEGSNCVALAACAHVEGREGIAAAYCSHAEGFNTRTTTTAQYSHAEGTNTKTKGIASHAEGNSGLAEGDYSHVEGSGCTARGINSHAGGTGSAAVGTNAFAHGYSSSTNADNAVSLGYMTKCYGTKSFAAGAYSQVNSSVMEAVAIGSSVKVIGNYGTAFGYYTHANALQTTIGKYNKESSSAASANNRSGDVLIIGNGTGSNSSTRTNAFRFTYEGKAYTYTNGSWNAGSADYAEYFEWFDANKDKEDRRGYFVTMEGNKIKFAAPGDYVLGIVSSQPGVVGNNPDDWAGRYVCDEFGSLIEEECEIDEDVIDPETGERSIRKVIGVKYKENPDYNPELEYVLRENRPEWAPVGMLGVLHVRDDGTCQVNGYCTVAEGGTATASETGYRVISRVNDHIVKVIFR